jgi:hypothetical protein
VLTTATPRIPSAMLTSWSASESKHSSRCSTTYIQSKTDRPDSGRKK